MFKQLIIKIWKYNLYFLILMIINLQVKDYSILVVVLKYFSCTAITFFLLHQTLYCLYIMSGRVIDVFVTCVSLWKFTCHNKFMIFANLKKAKWLMWCPAHYMSVIFAILLPLCIISTTFLFYHLTTMQKKSIISFSNFDISFAPSFFFWSTFKIYEVTTKLILVIIPKHI